MTGKIIIGTRIRDLSNIWSTSSSGAYLTNQSNNIGIGNTNPQYTLDITGDISVNCLEVISYPNSANYNNWTKNSNIISTTNNVAINKSTASVELDVSGNINISGTSQTGPTQLIGRQVVANISVIDSMTHNGNINIYGATLSGTSTDALTEVSGNIIASKYLVVNSDTSEPDDYLDGDAEIYGNIFINGGIGYTGASPFIFRVRDLVATDGTNMGVDNYDTFHYIDRTGNLVANGNSSYSLGNTSFKRRILQLPADVDEEVVKVYKNRLNTFAITNTGKVFSMGYNIDGQCGIFQGGGTGASTSMTNPITSLTRAFTTDVSGNTITGTFKKMIIASHTNYINFGLTDQGDLYGCGHNPHGTLSNGTLLDTDNFVNRGPNLVNFTGFSVPPRGYVKDALLLGSLTGTPSHTSTLCVLDNSGFVWTCGRNSVYGQTGQGSLTASNITTLAKVKMSASVDLSNIVSIYEYGRDTFEGFFAIDIRNDLYAWGRNTGNTLLDGTSIDISSAKRINTSIPTSPSIAKVWTSRQDVGDFFVQTTTGLIFGTGFGWSLGVGATSRTTGWTQVTHFNTTTKLVVEMYPLLGGDHTQQAYFAVTRNTITDVYTLWATGDNTAGNLGLGNATDQTVWNNVGLHSDIVRRIRKITGSGYNVATTTENTTILLDNGCVLVAGSNLPLYNSTSTDNRFRLL